MKDNRKFQNSRTAGRRRPVSLFRPAAAGALAAAVLLGISGCGIPGPGGGKKEVSSSTASSAASKKPVVSGSIVTADGDSIDIAPPSVTMLVNKTHLISESYGEGMFGTLSPSYYMNTTKDNRFDKRALPYLKQMLDDANKQGYNLKIVSGYRTYAYQKTNFNHKVKQFLSQGETESKAETDAAALVNPPGTSEHETGLAADIITANWYSTNKDLNDSFDQTAACQWMYAHCADYGFILRYPKGKQSSTTVEYEPWHYRFVGVALAKKITASGKSFEEYLGFAS